MAGAGYKLFSTGDVLSASDVNTYLQQQTVMVFASAAARTTALASVLAEGMVTYLKDTDVVEIYTGAAWVSLDDPNAIQNSLLTAKGSIVTATGASTPSALAVGTNTQVLTVDSTTATGLKWATPAAASSGLTLVSSTSISGATSSSFNSVFTSTYANYRIVISALGGTGTGTSEMSMRFRASGTDTSANYASQRLYGIATTAGAERDTFGSDEIWYGSTNPSGPSLSSATMEILNPQAAVATLFLINSAGRDASGPTVNIVNGANSATTQFDGFTLISNNGNISATVRIYGYQNS
jgi:hypothetical protein